MTKQRMRRGEPPSGTNAVALRGGPLDRDALRRDTLTNFALYGFYGLSLWIPDANHQEDMLLATKLLKARIIRRFIVGDLLSHNLELWDTGQAPHYDVVYASGADGDVLVDAFVATPSTTLINPHYDPDGGPDR